MHGCPKGVPWQRVVNTYHVGDELEAVVLSVDVVDKKIDKGRNFSVAGMAEIFPGDPLAVMVLAGTMEAGKLVIAGWLAAHWRRTNWKMRTVMMALVAGLALINAAGVFGKLVEAHVSVAASTRCRPHPVDQDFANRNGRSRGRCARGPRRDAPHRAREN